MERKTFRRLRKEIKLIFYFWLIYFPTSILVAMQDRHPGFLAYHFSMLVIFTLITLYLRIGLFLANRVYRKSLKKRVRNRIIEQERLRNFTIIETFPNVFEMDFGKMLFDLD